MRAKTINFDRVKNPHKALKIGRYDDRKFRNNERIFIKKDLKWKNISGIASWYRHREEDGSTKYGVIKKGIHNIKRGIGGNENFFLFRENNQPFVPYAIEEPWFYKNSHLWEFAPNES